jgi:hypothetical protein
MATGTLERCMIASAVLPIEMRPGLRRVEDSTTSSSPASSARAMSVAAAERRSWSTVYSAGRSASSLRARSRTAAARCSVNAMYSASTLALDRNGQVPGDTVQTSRVTSAPVASSRPSAMASPAVWSGGHATR